jgi:hypothetical protein
MYYEQQNEKIDIRDLLEDPAIREEIMTQVIIKRFEEEDVLITKEEAKIHYEDYFVFSDFWKKHF